MTTDAVPARASGDSIVEERWFRFLVRAAIAVLAFGALWLGADRYRAFFLLRAATLRSDDALWFSWVAATIVGGLLFGLATWLPIARIRFLPSRLALATVALVPLAHAWWIGTWGTTGSTGSPSSSRWPRSPASRSRQDSGLNACDSSWTTEPKSDRERNGPIAWVLM